METLHTVSLVLPHLGPGLSVLDARYGDGLFESLTYKPAVETVDCARNAPGVKVPVFNFGTGMGSERYDEEVRTPKETRVGARGWTCRGERGQCGRHWWRRTPVTRP